MAETRSILTSEESTFRSGMRGNLVYKVSLPDGMLVSRKLNGGRLDRT
jgi:hypothetical protein